MTSSEPTDRGPLQAPYSTMSPPDTALALRSLPRRWRGVFGEVDDDSDVAELAERRPSAGERSALELLAHVASALELAAREVRLVRATDRPTLSDQPPAGEVAGLGLQGALDRLAAAADAAANEVKAVPGSAWSRTGERDGRPVDLLTLAREAVRDGVEHLHAAESTLRQVRAQED